MDDWMTAKEAAKRWNLTERRVTSLCKEEKIYGAKKQGRLWMIPSDASKPEDHRVKTGLYKKNTRPSGLPLPIGISDYRLASSEYYYVDKTLMIRDFIDERPMVSLFTRPRRFGKTLNMDMLRTYFERTDEDTSVYFADKKIWQCGQKYRGYQGKYPVIFLTFKDVKKHTWEETFQNIVQIITIEYKRHSELVGSSRIKDGGYYHEIIDGTTDPALFDSALYLLSKMLHEHYGVAPVLIVDEYDTPIQQGYTEGFYDEVICFMRNLFSGCLKDNRHLSYGFLTGILRVAKESIFSGMNNLVINSIMDHKYSEYFGFTSDEILEMAAYYHAQDKYGEICKWYDGYRFGTTEIFNPWSVINYFRNDCHPGAYWQSTGSNDIIGEVLTEADTDIYEKLQALLQGETVTAYIDTGVIYPQVKSNPSSVFSFLMVAGYLKAVSSELSFNGDYMCRVALPNTEISYVYRKEILRKLSGIVSPASVISIQEAICSGRVDDLKQQLRQLLLQSVSFFDAGGENFYHGFMLGLCAVMEQYVTSSNRESGYGRYDIQLTPKSKNLPGIIMELKAAKDCSGDELKELSKKALQQIADRKYDTGLREAGITDMIQYGVAFCGKNVEITVVSINGRT